METIECIKTRQSIRKFKPEPVPQDTLEKLVEISRWSPSYKNTQPWEIMILSGEKKESASQLMLDLFEAGTEPTPDLPTPASWPPAEQARIDALLAWRSEKTGVDLSDPRIIIKAKQANFKFYGAPHGVYLFQDDSLSPWSLFDIGLFAQTFMLAAHDMGLATVPQAFATDYAKQIKKHLGIPETKRLVLGLSLGYPDLESPVNSLKTSRSPVDEIAQCLE